MTDQELKDLVAGLAVSNAEIQKQQANTDAQQLKTDAQISELKISQAKTDEQMKKTDEQMKETDKQMKETDKQMKKTDKQMKRTDAQLARSDKKWEKISAKIDKLGKLYGNSENTKGEEVEEFFYRYFQKNKKISDLEFDEVDRNIISSEQSEHDIVLINGKISALISVKYKLKKKDIDYLVNTELKRIKNFYHRIGSHHTLYGGVASYIISPEVEKYAKKHGVFAFSRAGENVKLLNNSEFRPTEV